MSLKYVKLDISQFNLEQIYNYLENMCNQFIPPLDQVVYIYHYADKLLQNADCFFVQKYDENIGFLAIYTNDYSRKIAFISSVSIIPKYQGTGISKKLIDFSIEHSRIKGMKCIKLEVNKNNTKAIRFYTKNSFMIESIYQDTILMKKSI